MPPGPMGNNAVGQGMAQFGRPPQGQAQQPQPKQPGMGGGTDARRKPAAQSG